MPKLLLDSAEGKDLYTAFCSSCHGTHGRGDGPVAPELKTAPANLTTLAKRAAGRFPAARVLASIDGSTPPPPGHGATDMPVWGPLFRQLELDEASARIRLQKLVKYLETLQVR